MGLQSRWAYYQGNIVHVTERKWLLLILHYIVVVRMCSIESLWNLNSCTYYPFKICSSLLVSREIIISFSMSADRSICFVVGTYMV